MRSPDHKRATVRSGEGGGCPGPSPPLAAPPAASCPPAAGERAQGPPPKVGTGLGVLPAAPSPCLTIDVGLLVDLCDAQQVRPLLLAAGPGLPPGQRGLEVELIAAVRQLVLVPEGLAVITCHHDNQVWVPPHSALRGPRGGPSRNRKRPYGGGGWGHFSLKSGKFCHPHPLYSPPQGRPPSPLMGQKPQRSSLP